MTFEDGPASSLEMSTLNWNQSPLYQESLKAWRSLIIFTVATYVRYVYSPTSKYVILKAKVNPSQKSATDAHIYESWIMIHKDTGSVKTGHCTCMAGWVWLLLNFDLLMIMWYASCIWNFRRGEVCCQVAAVLFKVGTAYRLGYNKSSFTSLPCALNQVSDPYIICTVCMSCTSWLVCCTH